MQAPIRRLRQHDPGYLSLTSATTWPDVENNTDRCQLAFCTQRSSVLLVLATKQLSSSNNSMLCAHKQQTQAMTTPSQGKTRVGVWPPFATDNHAHREGSTGKQRRSQTLKEEGGRHHCTLSTLPTILTTKRSNERAVQGHATWKVAASKFVRAT